MTPEQQRDVWDMLDRDHARQRGGLRVAGQRRRSAWRLLAADTRDPRTPPASGDDHNEDKRTIDLDWVAHDIRKFARLMTNHNGYVLEQFYSPLIVVSRPADQPAYEELLELGKATSPGPR